MAFGNYKVKADFGGQRITDRNSATAFMLTLTAIYRNKPHWKSADQALRQASKSAAAESRASAAFKAALLARPNQFHRTRKGGSATLLARSSATAETVLGALLVAGSITIYATNFYRIFETDLFATILLIQSLPFLSAVALVWLERVSDRKTKKWRLFRRQSDQALS